MNISEGTNKWLILNHVSDGSKHTWKQVVLKQLHISKSECHIQNCH